MFGRSFLSLKAPPLGRLTVPLLCTSVNATTAASTTTVKDRWSSYDSLHQVILRKVEQQNKEQVEVSGQRGARPPAMDSPSERTSPSSTSLTTVLVPSSDEKALVDEPSGPVGDLPSFLHHQVLFTEKIDGSNLGIWVRKEDPLEIHDETTLSAEKAPIRGGSWSIVSVQGRKQQLWPATEKNGQKRDLLKLPAYGNAGDLGELPLVMQDFAIRTAVKLGVDEIMIFGETLRAKVPSLSGQGNLKLVPCAVPSWHPFGYKLPKSDWRLHKLNSKTHELFSSVSMEMGMGRGASTPQTTPPGSPASESVAESTDEPSAQTPSSLPSNHEEMFHILRNAKAKEHLIFPPSAYFRGSLAEGIIKLHPIMMEKSQRYVEYLPQEEGLSLQPEPPQLFEGFFIVGEEVGTTTTAPATTTTTTHPPPTTAITTTTSAKDDRAEGIHAEKDHASTPRPLASGGFGCKWKSGFHETQKTPLDLDEIKRKLCINTSSGNTATTATEAYRVCELVAEVHEQTKSGRRTNTAEGISSRSKSIKARKTNPWEKLKGDIRKAFSHELSKRVALDSKPDKDIVSELVDAVLGELKTNQGELFHSADEESMLSLKVYIKNCVSSWIAKRAAKKK